jgi:hypothetical protein
MSPPRRPRIRSKHRITPEAIAAFKAKDLWRLHRALGLHSAHYSLLSRAKIGGYGYPPRQEHGDQIIIGTRAAALELRRQILEAIAEDEVR